MTRSKRIHHSPHRPRARGRRDRDAGDRAGPAAGRQRERFPRDPPAVGSGRGLRGRGVLAADGPTVVGAEDLAFSRRPAGNPAGVSADGGNGYDAGVGTLGGLVLILAAAGTAVAVHHSRKAKLSPA